MFQPLSAAQIAQLQSQLSSGQIEQVYTTLEDAGYGYAGWAKGVATTETVAGIAAVDYLKGTAMMGIGSEQCRNLTLDQMQTIKQQMAESYLKTLAVIAERSISGTADRDITAKEVSKFHNEVFENNNLSIQNWTLDAPFRVLQQLGGDDLVESYWSLLRDTGGSGLDAMGGNLLTLGIMLATAESASDPGLKALANDWLSHTPGFTDAAQRENLFNLITQWMDIQTIIAEKSVLDTLLGISRLLSDAFATANFDPSFLLGIGSAHAAPLDNLITSLQNSFHTAETTSSPLILDLDGDGVETTGVLAGTHFDHDGNGFAEQTGWVGRDDGLLVLDRNGNGTIDSGAELFGNNTRLASGANAANGFAALAELDGNRDGKVDANDAAFADLRLWKDANSNGITDSGELLTLDEASVQSLGLAYTQQSTTDAQGNQHRQAGQFVATDGAVRSMNDVWFAVDTARTVDTELVAVNDSIAELPDIAGFGNVHSLHQAMARDAKSRRWWDGENCVMDMAMNDMNWRMVA